MRTDSPVAILRHLASVETITIHAVVHDHWQAYPGHNKSLAGDLEGIIHYLDANHDDSMGMLRSRMPHSTYPALTSPVSRSKPGGCSCP